MNQLKNGLHLDNRAPVDEATWRLMADLDVAAVVVMENLTPEDAARLHREHPEITVYVRKAYDVKHITPGKYEDYYNGTCEIIERLVAAGYREEQIIVQLFNEPHAWYEGFGISREMMQLLNWAVLTGYNYVKGRHPNVRVGFTALAPGNKDVRVVEDAPDDPIFLEVCQEAIQRCDVFLAHVYSEWPDPAKYLAVWWGRRCDLYKPFIGDKEIHIVECSIGDMDQALRPGCTVEWLSKVAVPDPRIKIVCWWIGNAPGNPAQDPAWDRARLLEGGGERRPIANALVNYVRTAVPIPVEPPAPIITPPGGDTVTTLRETYPAQAAACEDAGVFEDAFRRWLLANTDREPTGDDVQWSGDQLNAAVQEHRMVLAKYPFPVPPAK